jgi:hypothetical protein
MLLKMNTNSLASKVSKCNYYVLLSLIVVKKCIVESLHNIGH